LHSVIYRLYKSNLSIVLIGLPIIIFLLWLGQFNKEAVNIAVENPSTLFGNFKSSLTWVWLDQLVAMLIIVLSAILINFIINKEEFFGKHTFIPAFSYVLVMSLFKEYQSLHPIIISNFFLILALGRLFQIHRSEDARRKIFDSSFFIGISALFYEYYLAFFLLIWITLIVLRPFIWREHVLGFIGLILPVLFLLIYQFLVVDSIEDWLTEVAAFFVPREQYVEGFVSASTGKKVVGVGIALVLSLLGASSFLKRQKNSSLRFKRLSNVVLFLGLFLVVITAIHVAFRYESPTVFMSSVFAAFLVSFYFFFAKRQKFAAFIFYVITLLVVVNIYYDFVKNIIG
jgi:hypothetical protein